MSKIGSNQKHSKSNLDVCKGILGENRGEYRNEVFEKNRKENQKTS